MIPKYLYSLWTVVGPAVANHLWQSTLFAAFAGLLTLALRKNHARTRFWLWLAASVKFLIPFSLLVGIGSHLTRPIASTGMQTGLYFAVEEVSQPFVRAAAPLISSAASVSASPSPVHLLPALLVTVWLCGFVAVLFIWGVRWGRMSAALQGTVPLREGREVEALRRLERIAGIRKRIRMLLSQPSLEPGIFGVARPALVWPEGISERLDDAHLETILAHEVWHVRRQDNLAGALHMLVEALFWFHPLVWWLGGRLVEERERACDEAVLQSGGKPQVYAESILKTCEFCVGSPLACVSGVTGSELKKRMVRIMNGRAIPKLDVPRKLLLAVAAFLTVAAPIGFGLANSQAGQANAPQSGVSSPAANALAQTAKFEVASIKRDKPSGPRMMFRIMNSATNGTFYATGPTVRMLLRMAYDVQDSQMVGGPSWISSDRFDIQAKADNSVDAELKKLSPEQAELVKAHMLQELLADRFKLTVHHETRQLPVYSLVVAKNGPKLEEAKVDTSGPNGSKAPAGPSAFKGVRMHMGGGNQELSFQDSPISFLTTILAQQLGRTVVDNTGLKGNYSFTLKWTPDEAQRRMFGGPGPGASPGDGGSAGAIGNGQSAPEMPPPSDSSGPSIFTAIQEQLGLKLKSEKGPVEVLVIDRVEQPSAN